MTGLVHRYRICGLETVSDVRLEEAQPSLATGGGDLRIRRVPVERCGTEPLAFRNYSRTAAGDLLEFLDVGRFLIRDGGTIDADIDPAFDGRLLGLPLLGPVFALLLHRRGHLVLHGSAVEIDGQAHVFLGDKGTGKSTTAAALIASGHRLIADDVVALEHAGQGIVINSGYPAMKLDTFMLDRFPQGSYRVLEPDDGSYAGGKRRVRLTQPCPEAPIPLARIHCLRRGAQNALAPLRKKDALQALVRFSYFPRLGTATLAPEETSRIFALAAGLSARVAVDLLTVKDGLDELAALGPFLEAEQRRVACLAG